MMNKMNQYHMVTLSPWPIMVSCQIQSFMVQTTMKINKKSNNLMTAILTLAAMSFLWWKDIKKEANSEGMHLNKTMNSIKISMMMFIISEVMFFVSFFWAYFHSSSSANMEIGQVWPPKMVETFNPINVPLLNTMILISSGFSITWSHHLMVEKKLKKAKMALMLTCMLAFYFTLLQGMEYMQAQFSITDSSYGTIFYVATGFHGAHVIIGSTFLATMMISMASLKFSSKHHIGFEMAAWYWHFVDIVWMILYLAVYWWGK